LPNEPYLAGYLLYLCEVFVPGVGVGELLDAWGGHRSGLIQRIGYAFALGIAVDTGVLAARTSGITVAGHALTGVDIGTLYFIIALGVVALVASLAYRRRFLFPVRPALSDAAVVAVMASLALVVWLFFLKYPIFPEYARPDFGIHVQIAEGLVSGSTVTIPRGILYYGVHFQLASAFVFVGGEPLVTAERTMGLLVVLSPLMIYLAATRIFSSIGAGIVTAALYVFSGAVWFDSVFNSGLYANFFGSLVALFLVVALLDVSERIRSPQAWLVFALAVLAAYFSHYTTITLLPVLLAVSLVQFIRKRSDYKRILIPSIVAIAPAVLVVLVRPRIIHLLLYLASASGGALTGSTTLSSALSFLPSLSYLALEVYDDIGFVFLLIFAAVYVYRGVNSKTAVIFVPLFWFAALIIAAPQSVTAWRYSYEALLPLVLMSAYGVYSLLPRLKIQKRRSGESNALGQYARVASVLLLLLVPMVVGSWGTNTVVDVTSNVQVQVQSQQSIYSAMSWLKSNTPTNSTYLSITDWRFLYTSLIFGRNTTYLYIGSQSQALSYALQQGFGYIIVTNLTTIALPLSPQQYPWSTFQPSANMTLVFNNTDVKVFQVS